MHYRSCLLQLHVQHAHAALSMQRYSSNIKKIKSEIEGLNTAQQQTVLSSVSVLLPLIYVSCWALSWNCHINVIYTFCIWLSVSWLIAIVKHHKLYVVSSSSVVTSADQSIISSNAADILWFCCSFPHSLSFRWLNPHQSDNRCT